MPYPMKSKLIPVEVIRNVLDKAESDGWKLQPVIARHKLSILIWDNILNNFPEIKLANEIIQKYKSKELNITEDEYLDGICAECD